MNRVWGSSFSYIKVCAGLYSPTSLESLSVETASSTGGLRTTRELGEITDVRQDFLLSYSKKKVILLNQCLKIAFGKAETTVTEDDFY